MSLGISSASRLAGTGIVSQSFHYCMTSLEDYHRQNRIMNEFQIRRFVLAVALSCVVDGMKTESLGSVGGLSQTLDRNEEVGSTHKCPNYVGKCSVAHLKLSGHVYKQPFTTFGRLWFH